MAKEMKVLVISGFLGAGKTTFIKSLVKKTGKSFCILENEYAGSKVDTTILEEQDDVNVWELTEGCICCTMKTNFANKILNISGLFEPEYLIVEATGIGFLSKIIRNIQTIEYERIRLMQAITIVDAATVLKKEFFTDELCLDQLKNAQVIVVSKSESLDHEERLQIAQILRSINAKAELVTEHYSLRSEGWWNRLLVKYFDGHIEEPEKEESRWDSLTLNDISMSNLTDLWVFLGDLLNGCYGRVIRVKGMLPAGVGGETAPWFLADISGETYSVKVTEPKERSNLVFIGENLRKDEIRRVLGVRKQAVKMKVR